MNGVRNIVLKFVGDTKGLGKSTADGERQLGKWQKGLRNVNRVALGVGAGVGAAAIAWGKSTMTALAEVEKLSAQTDSVVKSMRVKWTSTEQVEAFAGKLEKLTGIEAEQIQAGQNLLLTFGNIQNKVGAGNKIFDRTTSVMNDMSVALGQSTTSSATQLGKALNDPIKGVTALQKVGVSFTQSQKDQIKALVESGDTMKAQKLILAELEKQFGGSAKAYGETMPGQVAKLKNAFGEFSESLLVGLMPTIKSLLTTGTQLAGWLMENPGLVKGVAIALVGLAGFVASANAAYKVWTATTRVASAASWLYTKATKANTVASNVNTVASARSRVATAAAAVATKGMTAAQRVLNLVMRASPLARVVTVLGLIAGALVTAWNRSETFRRVAKTVFRAVASAVGWVIDAVKTLIGWVQDAIEWFDKLFNREVQGRATQGYGVGVEANLQAGRRAKGGPVTAGRSYLVGERGPELLTMGGNGHVTPNHELGGGAVYVTVELDGAPIAARVRAEQREADRSLKRRVAMAR